MVPPWEKFPDYERMSIGWRMGPGEGYRYQWEEFIERLPEDRDDRKAYLKRHRPAPLTWGDIVLGVLDPELDVAMKFGCTPEEIDSLLEQGLVAYDAAYHTWALKQRCIAWPWLFTVGDTPEEAARVHTREFWFFSRQLAAARGKRTADPGEVPAEWQRVLPQVLTGRLGEVDPKRGLLTLAQMLCAGQVQPPWTLGLSPSDFTNSYEEDMPFCDAFRLWMACAFDDGRLLRNMLETAGVPTEWKEWIDEHMRHPE